MKSKSAKAQRTKATKVIVFEEADGYHWCPANLGYLDARGPGYPSRAAARRAASAHYAQPNT